MSSEKKTRKQRPIHFVCSAIKGDDLIQDVINVATAKEATEAFQSKHKKKPAHVAGPFYKVIGNSPVNERQTVHVENPTFTNEKYSVVYKGWNFNAQGLRAVDKFKDNQLLWLMDAVSPTEEGVSKPKFGPVKPILEITQLQHVKQL